MCVLEVLNGCTGSGLELLKEKIRMRVASDEFRRSSNT